MAHLEQGQDLQEQPIVDANGNIVDSAGGGGNSGNNKGGGGGKFGPKQIALVAAALVVLGMLLFMIFGGKSGETESGDSTSSSSATSSEEDPFMRPDESSMSVPDGFIDPSSKPAVSEPEVKPNRVSSDDPYEYFSYSAEEVKTLRGLGYTGDEIEYFAQQGRTVASLVQESNDAKNKENEAWRKSVLDGASDEFKNLMDKTYLGGRETKSDVAKSDIVIGYNLTENVDYERIGVYNYQAWIKVHLSYGDVFMQMPIERFASMPDTGNIVVSYTARCDSSDTVLEITNLKEVSV